MKNNEKTLDALGNVHIWLGRLTRLMDDQQQLLQRLDAIGEKQSALIEAVDTQGLLTLLGERQVLIEKVLEIQEELDPFRQRWDELNQSLKADQQEAVAKQIDDLGELMKRVCQRDEHDSMLLSKQRDHLADQLTGVSRGRSALSAYHNPDKHNIPRYQDREC